jgi:hypothetical protein
MRTASYPNAWAWKSPGDEQIGAGVSIDVCGQMLHLDAYPVQRDFRGQQQPVEDWAEEFAALRRLVGPAGKSAQGPLATMTLDGMTFVPVGYPFASSASQLLGPAGNHHLPLPSSPAAAPVSIAAGGMWQSHPAGGFSAPLEVCGAPMLARLVPSGADPFDDGNWYAWEPEDVSDLGVPVPALAPTPEWDRMADDLYRIVGEDAKAVNRAVGSDGHAYVLLLLPAEVTE